VSQVDKVMHLWLEKLSTSDVCEVATTYAGITLQVERLDGKSIGTVVENKLRYDLAENFDFDPGSVAKGLDFRELEIDVKVTLASSLQNSAPYASADQARDGLGYSLLIFTYERDGCLVRIIDVFFLPKTVTADHRQSEFGLLTMTPALQWRLQYKPLDAYKINKITSSFSQEKS
jgi:hypothetical protein